jgi:hypothetical protein
VGLVALSPTYTRQRLSDAVEDGLLTAEQAEFYRKASVSREPGRRGSVWLFTDRASLAMAPRVGYLLENWGGEGINMGVRSRTPEMDLLEHIGEPTVVVANLDLSIHCGSAHPGVLHGAVKRILGHQDHGTAVKSAITVAASYIESIEHPGSPFWQHYVWTPRTGYRYLP